MLTLSPAEVSDYCHCSPHSGGCDAQFFPIDKEWGFKYYKYESDRDRNHDMQKLAAEHGLAPKIGDKLDFCHPAKKAMRFGFFTEIVPVILHDHPDYDHLYWWPHEDDETGEEYETWEKLGESEDEAFDLNTINWDSYKLPHLTDKLLAIGFARVTDLHNSNVGFMNDGTFVCFDFSCCFLSNKESANVCRKNS